MTFGHPIYFAWGCFRYFIFLAGLSCTRIAAGMRPRVKPGAGSPAEADPPREGPNRERSAASLEP